ncbi:MAG: NYN domain-containing protein [Candidatus Magasanikiibacteriota bacterium]
MLKKNNNRNPLKHPEQRVGVFIDVQNMYYSAKNLYNKKVNFGNIVSEAVAGRKLIRAIAYVVRTESKDEQPFFEALYNLGIETREKDLQIFSSGMKKADWDVGLTVDAIRLSPSLDAIVIVSGDGDYIPLVEYLQSTGKQVEVAAFGDTSSAKLIESVDDFIDLGKEKEKFLIGTLNTPPYPQSAPAKRQVERKNIRTNNTTYKKTNKNY